ncbi:MAG TPA: sigma-54 dependent transcriptional regulator, partial [Gemmataceae bacterium]|nr:sigma-54 dependent transcriptional regulator [Gemmataceae bacterium]
CATVLLSDEYQDHQAVAFLRAGATDYLGLPLGSGRLTYLMDTLTLRARFGLRQKGAAAVGAFNGQDPFHFVLAPEMVELMEQIRRVGPQDTTLLFTGETGTGKTRLARLVHELSPRRDEPFLVIDCGALSPTLIESEMFGHVKGAFTGAERDRVGKFAAVGNGTLLLDEINSLPRELQSKLLRAVDERVFEPVGSNKSLPLRARLITAANTPLEREVVEGRFRADLYYRLNVVGFYLSPLRERRAAIAPLANKFVAEFAARNARPIDQIARDALEALEEYNWPGNIRELRNVIERAVALCPGSEIQLRDLPEAISAVTGWQSPQRPILRAARLPLPGADRVTLTKVKQDTEILRITEALEKHNNNRLRAAAELGISRMALYKKLHKYGMMGTA